MKYLAVALALILASMDRAPAHEFSLGVHASDDNAYEKLISAVRGALIAADERDGHPEETSDGHLGGVDVHIVPFQNDRRVIFPELVNTHEGQLDFLLLLDADTAPSPALPGMSDQTIILDPGALPDGSAWSLNRDAKSFVERYRHAWASDADIYSAQGYNAARRIDEAIRPHDGVDRAEAISQALARTRTGVDWR